MNEREVVRLAVTACMAAVGAVMALILSLFLVAAAVSPEIDIPGVHLSSITGRPAGD
jgi:hypothetical protein